MSAIGDVLTAILDHSYAGLSNKPAVKVVAPGGEVAWDELCGQMWVRMIDSNPRYNKPMSGCPHSLTITVGVGVIRCVHSLDDNGRPPTTAQMVADGQRMATDMEELLTALACWKPPNTLSSELGNWSPLGPLGGAAGGEWTMTFVMSL